MRFFSHVHQADPEKLLVLIEKQDEITRTEGRTAKKMAKRIFEIMLFCYYGLTFTRVIIIVIGPKKKIGPSSLFRENSGGVHVGVNDFGNVKAVMQPNRPNQPRTRTGSLHRTCGRVGGVGVRRVELEMFEGVHQEQCGTTY